MGNIPSVSIEGEESFENEEDKTGQRQGVSMVDLSNAAIHDFSVLFDTDKLLKALVDVKDPDKGGVIRSKGEIEQWLKNMTKRGEVSVSDVEFMDFAISKGVKKEDAQEFFSEIDPDRQGSIEIAFLLKMLKDKRGPSMGDALLLPCTYVPGVLDSYILDTSKSMSLDLGVEIIKFLRRYRVDSLNLAPTTLNQLLALFQSREQLINGQFGIVESKQAEEIDGISSENDEMKVVVSKCYSNITCSSSESNVYKLTDGNTDTYWQSNGSPRSHWIRIHMLPGIRLKELCVWVNSSDDSYMPKQMTVSVGNSDSNLKQLKSVPIPKETTGRLTLIGALSAEFTVVQINIRQCHSDGCDTRVRQLYIKGYKHKKMDEVPTVLDGLLMWHLGLIASVSKAAMPIAPHLRDTLLTQTKTALKCFPPLSLSRSSPLKPEFLTPVVLKEMDAFIKSLCVPGDNCVSLEAEALMILLEFSLSVGNINSLLDCLLHLLDNVALSLSSEDLMKKLMAVEERKSSYHTHLFNLQFVKSDCKSEEGFSFDGIFTGSASPFKSVKDVKVANVIVKENDLIQPVKLIFKNPVSDNSARAVLMFGIEDGVDIESEEFLSKYSKYDTFTNEEWLAMKKRVNDKEIDNLEDGLLLYLEQSKDLKEFEDSVPPSVKPIKYLLFKFIGQESADRVSVSSIKVRGHRLTLQHILVAHKMKEIESSIPQSSSDSVIAYDCGHVLVRLLLFMCRMVNDINVILNSKGSSVNDIETLKESHICVQDFSLEKVWNLYIPLTLSDSDDSGCYGNSTLLCLILLRNGIRFLVPPTTSDSNDNQPSSVGGAEGGVASDNSLTIVSEVLAHLCSLVDNPNSDPLVQSLAKDIVKEGVVVFFPGSKARKKYLLDMISKVLTGEQPSSWWLKFEALCSYFSQKDNNSLLELNWDVENIDNIASEDSLSILTTIITVATKQALVDVKSQANTRQDDLVKLLCSMQSSLLFWCKHLLQASAENQDEENVKKYTSVAKETEQVLIKYVECLRDNSLTILKKVLDEKDKETCLKILKKSIIAQSLPQLVLFLSTFCNLTNLPYYSLLNSLLPLSTIINSLCVEYPAIAPNLNSEELKCEEDHVVAVWTRESKHNYEDNCKISEDFIFPSASKFVIEFDPRCHTERRYDYVSFVDSTGTKVQYDDNYGSDRWPTRGEFKGPKLTFHFHSDGSNNYWGYKFTIKAYGKPSPPLHWLYDLHVSLSRLFGQYVSALISTQTLPVKAEKQEVKKEEDTLLKSDLWKTLFRAGLVVGSKLTRSLSGAHEAVNPNDTNLSSMLFEIAEGEEMSPLMEVCRSAKQLPSFGGPSVDRVIGAVFAALIWHSQEIREELNNMKGTVPKATPNVLDAFTAAEALRRELVESRQKIIEAKEKEEDEEIKSKMDEDEPLNSCRDKAVFLLKFAGLTRVTYDASRPSSPITSRPSWGQKSGRLQKSQSVVSTVGRIKQQISRETKPLSPMEKHPSFETVLSFVRNLTLTVANVESLLHERTQLARKVSEGFTFAAEYLRRMACTQERPEIPLLTFLQNMLLYQRKFPRHYAIRADGCGLDLENNLRRSFQMFIHRLIDVIKLNSIKPNSNDRVSDDGISMLKNVFSHLLDMTWEDYDLNLLKDLQLPDYLFESIIGSSTNEKQVVVEKFEGEDEMLEKYKLFMRFMEKWDEVSRFTEFLSSDIAQEDLRAAHLFVVAMTLNSSNNKNTLVSCDGCGKRVEGAWYRNLDVDEDCDLCPTCFNNGTGNRPSSYSEEHLLLHVGEYLCNGCGMGVVTHRFRKQSDKQDYCIGCFRKESDQCQWTVYLQKECSGTDKSNRFKSVSEEHSKGFDYCNGLLTEVKEKTSEGTLYNRQHNWLLFSSFTLMMANRLNQKEKTEDPQYQRNACDLLTTCLQLIVQGLKFALSAEIETFNKKKELELKKKEDEEKAKAEEEEKKKKAKDEEETKTDTEKNEDQTEKNEDQTEGNEDQTDKNEDQTEKNEDQTEKNEDQPDESAPVEATTDQPPLEGKEGVIIPSEPVKAEEQPTEVTNDKPNTEDTTVPEGDNKETTTDETDSTHMINVPVRRSSSVKSSLQKQTAIASEDRLPTVNDDGVTTAEKAFGMTYYDSMLGLLASVLPKELSLLPWISVNGSVERIVGDIVLPQLFRIARCPETSSSHRLQALTVAIKYMSRVSPEVSDHSIEVLDGLVSEGERKKTNGVKTIEYLFKLGTTSLTGSDIPNVSSITDCILLLSMNSEWKVSITQKIAECINIPTTTGINLSAIFGLLLLAGFPKIPRIGSSVRWCKSANNNEENYGIIVTPVADNQANVVDIATRNRCSLKVSELKVDNSIDGCVTESQLPVLVSIIKDTVVQSTKESPHQTEYRWVLSLALKSLGVLLRGGVTKKITVIETILSEELLPFIVKLACKPTHFSRQWQSSDLEILGISCYKPFEEKQQEKNTTCTTKETEEVNNNEQQISEGNSEKAGETTTEDQSTTSPPETDVGLEETDFCEPIPETEETQTGSSEQESKPESDNTTKTEDLIQSNIDETKDHSADDQVVPNVEKNNEQETVKEKATPTKKSREELEQQAALRDLTDEIKDMLKIMKEAFQCSLAEVRAMYEMAEQDTDKFLMSSEKYYDSETAGLKLPKELLESSKRWMPLHHSSSIIESAEYQDDQEDTGVTGFMTVSIDLKNVEAKADSQSELKKSLELLPSSKESKKKQKELSERETSYQLLQDQLKELKDTPSDREMISKVHRAQVILQAREVLRSLLLHWPQEAPKINSTLLGGLEMTHWFSLLDLLVKGLTQDERNKVLQKVVACSESDELVSLGLIAAQCMKQVTVAIETKEFKYQNKEKTYMGKIVMSGAACMKIKMEKKKTLIGTVELAANGDFSEHHWSGTGTGEGTKKEEQEWNIPGNVVHYKVTLNKVEKSDEKKAWSMRVSGLQKGRFETSYSLLHILLGTPTATPTSDKAPTLLPIVKLWPNLIAASCDLTGDQRIKVVGILLQLLLWNSSAQKNEGAEGMGGASSSSTNVQRLDLAMLKPLWSLHTSMSKEYDKGEKSFHLKPEILRALTELFLVVENTALDWKMEQDLLVETITEDSLSQLLEKGISNVAYTSLGIGLSNQVTEAFIEAKKNYVPPAPGGKDDDVDKSDDDGESSSSSSSSDTSDSSDSSPSDSFDDEEDEDSDMYY